MNIEAPQASDYTFWNTVQKHAPFIIATCAVGVVAQGVFGIPGLFVFVATCTLVYSYREKIQAFLNAHQNRGTLLVAACVSPFFGSWGMVVNALMVCAHALKDAFWDYKIRQNLEESFTKIEELETSYKTRAAEREKLIQEYTEKEKEITRFWQETKKEAESSHATFTQEADQLNNSIESATSTLQSLSNTVDQIPALTLEYERLNQSIQNALTNNEKTQTLIQKALQQQ